MRWATEMTTGGATPCLVCACKLKFWRHSAPRQSNLLPSSQRMAVDSIGNIRVAY